MKLILSMVLLLACGFAFADSCTEAGLEQAETAVRDEVEMQHGVVAIEASTHSSVSNIYGRQLHCTYSTSFTFMALDLVSGTQKRFIGHSVMNNQGMRPMPTTIQIVKKLL